MFNCFEKCVFVCFLYFFNLLTCVFCVFFHNCVSVIFISAVKLQYSQ